MNIVFATGTSLGAPVGGVVADYFGWRWSFGIQIPLVIISTLIVSFLLHLPAQEISSQTIKQKLKRVDFAGAFTLVPQSQSQSTNLCLDTLRYSFDLWIESWRERIALDSSRCSHHITPLSSIFRSILNR